MFPQREKPIIAGLAADVGRRAHLIHCKHTHSRVWIANGGRLFISKPSSGDAKPSSSKAHCLKQRTLPAEDQGV